MGGAGECVFGDASRIVCILQEPARAKALHSNRGAVLAPIFFARRLDGACCSSRRIGIFRPGEADHWFIVSHFSRCGKAKYLRRGRVKTGRVSFCCAVSCRQKES